MAAASGPLAQLVEQGTLNPKVAGSIPARPISLAVRPGMRQTARAHGLGGRGISSGTGPLAGTAETVDDTVRRLVVERSHDLVTLCDLTGAIVYASPSWSALGWDPADVAGVEILDLIHPDDHSVAIEAGERLMSGAAVSAATIRLRRASGSFAWFEVNGVSVHNDEGELRFVLGIARDVSEREELRSRLRDLDAVYRFADAVAGASDLDQVLEAGLDALLEATGADRAAVLLYDDEDVMRFRAWRGLSDAYRAFTEGHSPWEQDAEDPQPVLVEDVAAAGFEPELERVVREEGIASLAFIPLVRGGRLLGKFMLYQDEPHVWSDRDLLLSRTIANHLASVTERTQAQQELHDSREQLATVLRTVEEGITVSTADGRLLFANDASARQFGKASVEELLAAPPGFWTAQFELFDADGRPLGPEDLPARKAFGGRENSLVIRRRERETGDERWLSARANPVFGPDGAVELVVNVARDITDEVLAEHGRSRSEAQLHFLARASELLVASLNWERTLDAIAELAVPALAGYLVIDVLDENDELHWVVAVHADPKKTELVRELRTRYPPTLPTHPIQVALRTGETQLLPDLQSEVEAMAHDTKHGRAIQEIANTSGLVAPLVARGRTLGVISLGTVGDQPRFDESDREMATELARRISIALDNARLYGEAQERAHAAEALEYVADGVFLVDELGIVRLWNPTAAVSLRRSAAEAVGRPIAELLGDWPSLRTRIPVASDPQAGAASRPETLPVDVRGEERWLSISAVRFPGGTVYAFRDVTDERAVEQMKTDFVSTVSHELRTPLAAIYGAAVTLKRRDVVVEETQRDRLLEVISGESDRLARIVNDILWASRLESGRMQVAIERCDAAALAAEVADVSRSRVPAEIELVVTTPEGLPSVAADPDKLRQILLNLLDNAVKYSPDGGRVVLEVARTGGRVRFQVSDEGLGIPPAEQDRIFEKFFRLDPNLTRGVGGTGLGLYISRELVTRMNGRIWVVSDGRTGSSFFLELPLA
jgi:PAS domain S-box-containing protein